MSGHKACSWQANKELGDLVLDRIPSQRVTEGCHSPRRWKNRQGRRVFTRDKTLGAEAFPSVALGHSLGFAGGLMGWDEFCGVK